MVKSWSFSEVSIAHECLRKYHLAVNQKIKPEGLESSDLVFGSAIHAAIDALFNGEDEQALFLSFWKMNKDRIAYGRMKYGELEHLGMAFLSRFRELHLSKYKRWVGETRYYGEYKGVKLEGTVDWVGEYMDVPTLVDWKTSGYNFDLDKIKVATQLHLYAHLLHQNTSMRVKQLMYQPFIKSTGAIQRPLIIPFSEETNRQHLDDMLEYVHMYNNQTTWPRKTNACLVGSRKCAYLSQCMGAK